MRELKVIDVRRSNPRTTREEEIDECIHPSLLDKLLIAISVPWFFFSSMVAIGYICEIL
jgi:hypothetical protein